MKYSHSVEYNISTKLDKSGLTQLQTQIKQVELTMQQMANTELLNPTKVQNAREQLQGLSTALNKAFNPSLGMLDLAQFRKELSSSKVTADGLQSAFRLTGAQGSAAFNNLAKQIGHFNSGIERTSSVVDKMFVTFSNTFRWGLISSFFSSFMNAIHQSVQYAKDLDDSLTQIMLVTDYSRDSMNEYARAANEAAKAVGQTTVGMTNASLIFAQQGYDLNQSQQLATLSAKLANASQQDTAATSDQITAYMNAYGLQNSMDELVQAMDNWAKIANISAADVEEIALASQRAASMANAVGVSGEALAAQIATIESVTREAPEQIGNGLKTLYARFSDLKLGKDDEDGIGLGKVTSTLQQIGVQVLDAFGNVRDMDDIMEDLMAVWKDLDDTSKTAAAQSLAGKHQVNRFMALMENSDMYQEYLGATGEGASGTLEQMNQEYLDSLQGRTAKLQATLEGLFNDVFTTDMVYPLIDVLTKLAEVFDTLFKSVGGGPTVILGLASAFMRLFSTNIARGINDFISNQQIGQLRKQNIQNIKGTLVDTGLDQTEAGQYIQMGADRAGSMNSEQYRAYEEHLDNIIVATQNVKNAQEELIDTYMNVGAAIAATGKNIEDLVFIEDSGNINFSGLIDELNQVSPEQLAEKFKSFDWKTAIEGAENFSKSLGNLNGAFTLIKNGNGDLDFTFNALDKANDDLQILNDTGIISKQTYEQFSSTLKRVENELKINGEVSETTSTSFEDMNVHVANFSQNLRHLNFDTLTNGAILFTKGTRNLSGAIEQLGTKTRDATGYMKNLDKQMQIDDIIKTASAFGQLSFSIQSFANLPSIWNDKDLSNGEKCLQIISNLTVALPSLLIALKQLSGITSFGQIFEGFKAFGDIESLKLKVTSTGEALNQIIEKQEILNAKRLVTSGEVISAKKAEEIATNKVTEAEIKYNAAVEEHGKNSATARAYLGHITRAKKAEEAATNNLTIAEEKENEVTEEQIILDTESKVVIDAHKRSEEELAAAINLKNAAIKAGIAIAAAAIMLLISLIQKQKEAQQELVRDQLQESTQQLDSLKDGVSNIEELYKAWDKTGEKSKELNTALEEQLEALDLIGSTATQNYDVLIGKIDDALSEQLLLNAALRNNPNNPDRPEYNNVPLTNNDFDYSDYNLLDTEFYSSIGISREGSQSGGTQRYIINNQGETLSAAQEAWQEANTYLGLAEQKRKEADRNLATAQESYNQALEMRNNAVYDYDNGLITHEELLTLQEAYTAAEHNLQVAQAARDSIEEEVEYYRQVKDFTAGIVADNKEAYEYRVKSAEIEAEGYARSQKNNPFANSSYEESEEFVRSLNEENDYQLSEEDIRRITLSSLDTAGNTEVASAERWKEFQSNVYSAADQEQIGFNSANILIENLDQLREQFGTSFEDLIKFADLIDFNDPDSVAQFLNYLENVIKPALEDGISVDEIIEGLKSGEPTETLYSDEEILKRERDDKGYVGEEWGRNTESVIEYADSLEELAKVSDKIDDDLEGNREAALAIADANARLNKGLKTLKDNWEDWNDILSDSANEGTEEYAEALKGTEEALSNILDFDIGTGFANSAQFIQDNADIIEAAINGDVDAIQTLRMAAFDQILIDVNADPANLQGDLAECYDLIANTNFDDIEIGASLNDTGLYDALTTMMYAINTDVTEMQNVLNSLGFEPNITWYEATAGDTDQATGLTTYTYKSEDGETHTVQMRSELTQNTDGVIRIPIINGSRTTYQGSPGAVARSGGGNRGGGGGCFVAGTLVSLQSQFKNIEDIQIGDIVLSYNEEIHQNEYSIVLQTMIHDVTEEIYDLYIEDEILTVTGIHRFYIRRKHDIEWIPASDLHIGDYVLFADGNWHPIFKIKIKVRSLLVYNFEVSHNHNYYVGRNQILAHNKGGGGGGGGGSAKTIQPKEKKEHKKDYYERVNSELDKLKEQLSGIEKQEDRLIGDKARANQAKQIALIKKEIDLEKDRLRILQDTKDSELKDVRAAITAKDTAAQDILKGRGIKFDIPNPEYDPETNIIINYEKISEKIDEAHNKLIDQYNEAAKAGNEDLTKTIEEAIKKYDDYSGAILENVQRQNDIQKEIESTKNTIQELEDSIEDIQIELYKASMEAIDNLKDLNEKWAEFEGFLTGMPTDSPFRDLTVDLLKLNSTFEIGKEDAAKYYQEIIDGKIAAQNATTDQAEKEAIQASINYFVGLRDGLTDDMLNNGLLGLAMEDLKQLEKWYKDPSLKDNPFGNNQKALAEAYQEGYERVLELSQDWQDLQEDIIDSVIDGYDEIADKQDRQLEKYTRLADQLEQLADNYALSYGDESYQALSDIGKQQGETLRAQLQQYREIYKYWQNEYQEALKTGNEELINSIEDHMNDVEDEMRDIANEAAETFVDAYEKAVDAAIQKMNKTLIGETDFDRLDRNWEWQDKMIEGYLDDVEKAYEIEKLRGDYMDMLNEAQGASLATQNKIRAAMNEQLQLLEDQTTVSQFDVDLANARLLVLQKQIALEDAQRNKNQMQLRRDSQGNYRYVYRANQDEIAKARKELLDAEREVYKMSQDHMKEVRQNVADAINEFIDQWRTISTDPNLSEDQRKEQLEELVNNIKPILAVYAEDLKNGSDGIAIALGDMINASTDEMAVAASDMLSKIYDEEGNLAEKTGTLWWDVVAKFTNGIFPNIDSAIATLATTTYGEMDQLRNNLTGPDGVIPDVTDALIGEDGFAPALIAAADAITNEDPTQGLNAAMKSLGDSLEAENTKLKEGINNITNYTTALAGAITTLSQAQGAITDLQKITVGNIVYQFRAEVQDNTQNASPNIEAASYDTGGYTGDWGEDGKIAVLHQKELILNAEDTRNILSAVDIVRQMTSTLGNVLANYSIGDTPNSLASSVFNTVDQRVEIKAEFPNVKDAFEIETALTNLSDKAYQYAHRKI